MASNVNSNSKLLQPTPNPSHPLGVDDNGIIDDLYIDFKWTGNSNVGKEVSPDPASKHIPFWYKKLPGVQNNTTTAKMCSSFRDGTTIGYVLPFEETATIDMDRLSATSQNIHFTPHKRSLFENTNTKVTDPDGVIETGWEIRTPPEYKTYVTHPCNRHTKLTPYTMLMDTSEEFTPLTVPFRCDGGTITVSPDDLFVQIFPFFMPTTENLSLKELTSSHLPEKHRNRMQNKHHGVKQIRGYYRREAWDPKRTQSVVHKETTPKTLSVDREKLTVSTPEYAYHYYEKHKDYGAIPRAVRMPTYEYSDFLSQWGDITKWMNDAQKLGWGIRAPRSEAVSISSDGKSLSVTPLSDREEPMMMNMGETGVNDEYPGPRFLMKAFNYTRIAMPPGRSELVVPTVNHQHKSYKSYTGFVDADNYLVRTNVIGRAQKDDFEVHAGNFISQTLPIDRKYTLLDARVYN